MIHYTIYVQQACIFYHTHLSFFAINTALTMLSTLASKVFPAVKKITSSVTPFGDHLFITQLTTL